MGFWGNLKRVGRRVGGAALTGGASEQFGLRTARDAYGGYQDLMSGPKQAPSLSGQANPAAAQQNMQSYRNAIMDATLGNGRPWENDPGYQANLMQVDRYQRSMGQQRAGTATRRGQAGYTPGQGSQKRYATEDEARAAELRMQAGSAAQASYFDRLLRGAGFEKGLQDQEFKQWYMRELIKQGWLQQDAQREANNLAALGGLVGGALGFWAGGPAGAAAGYQLGSSAGANSYTDPNTGMQFDPNL